MRIVILAAGQGKRMKFDGPKVLTPLFGKPMIMHLLDVVKLSQLDPCPIVVVGYQQEKVRVALADYQVEFVVQEKQLGTGHAVQSARLAVRPDDDILVLYGDQPQISVAALQELVNGFKQAKTVMAMLTYLVSDFGVYADTFKSFGRIIRDAKQEVVAIREAKDLKDSELDIKEINPAYYIFSGIWLWQNLDTINNANSQGEYYLTDLVQKAFAQGQKVQAITRTNLVEAVGFNTIESLKSFEQLSRLNI